MELTKKELQQDHPTKRIPLKYANVDVEMVPLVNWLNSYESVWTHYCCQGEPRKEDETNEDYVAHRPYVLFTCISSIDLISILSIFEMRADTYIFWNEVKSQIEYCTRFYDQQSLLDTIETIEMLKANIQRRMVHVC